MGVSHLIDLKSFLEKNKKIMFSKTYLRNRLKQNYNTMIQNLDYLVNEEKVVKEVKVEKHVFYQWKENELLTKKVKKA